MLSEKSHDRIGVNSDLFVLNTTSKLMSTVTAF